MEGGDASVRMLLHLVLCRALMQMMLMLVVVLMSQQLLVGAGIPKHTSPELRSTPATPYDHLTPTSSDHCDVVYG